MNELELLKNIKKVINKNPYYYQIKDLSEREIILNDTFMNIWEKINNNELSNEWEDIKGYAFISARNNCLWYLRRKRRKDNIEVEEEMDITSDNPHNKFEREDEIKHIFNQIDKIKLLDIDREILNLRRQGLIISEIAELLNMDYLEVKRINKNIIDSIRKSFKNNTTKSRVGNKFIYYVKNNLTNEINTFERQVDLCRFLHIGERRIRKIIKNGGNLQYTITKIIR